MAKEIAGMIEVVQLPIAEENKLEFRSAFIEISPSLSRMPKFKSSCTKS